MENEYHILPPQKTGQYPQGVCSSQQSVASRPRFSPSVWGYAISPECADDDALFGFNPNNTFPHCYGPCPSVFITLEPRTPFAFPAGLATQYATRRRTQAHLR
ncbi:hypothetical protein D1007_57919 [Hordeum vulgare]|nr:hypothetical protein D1007_57919 [Hordeum vulgare]